MLIDVFPFFDEKELLSLRFNLHHKHVDKFVILEADRTHTGEYKGYNLESILLELNIDSPKIEIVKVKLPSQEDPDFFNDIDIENHRVNNSDIHKPAKALNCWARDRIQRDSVSLILDRFEDDTKFLISDCDEIIDPFWVDAFKNIKLDLDGRILKLPLVFLQGRADHRFYHKNGTPVDWKSQAYVCTKEQLTRFTATELRNNLTNIPHNFPSLDGVISEVGWHFSWMGDSSRKLRKLKSFRHYFDEVNSRSGLLNSQKVEEFVRSYNSDQLKDILDRNQYTLKNYPVENLPQIIFDLEIVKNFLLPL